jgi:CHRD domain
MKLIKLTAFSSLILSGLLFLSSCEREAEEKKTFLYQKSGIVLSGAQEVPANPSAGLGTMDVSYSKETRLLTYKVTWTGLVDSVTAMHIHGLSPLGFNSGVVQNIIAGVGTGAGTSGAQFSAQLVAGGPLRFSKTGTISGIFLVDGSVVKEENLLNGFYYMNIHTKAYGGGEIKGQIRFQ